MSKTLLKRLLIILTVICAAIAVFAFSACDDGTDNNNDNKNENENGSTGQEDEDEEDEGTLDSDATNYVFEAEYTYITDDLHGLGSSGSVSGLNLINEASKASNGFFVGSLGKQSPITFKITSDAAVTVTLKAKFGSNGLGSCVWNSDTFNITVNGEAMNYKEFTTSQSTDVTNVQNFKTFTLGEIDLVEGENTIVFCAGENLYLANSSSAPSIDCISISTTATLTMETYESNLD